MSAIASLSKSSVCASSAQVGFQFLGPHARVAGDARLGGQALLLADTLAILRIHIFEGVPADERLRPPFVSIVLTDPFPGLSCRHDRNFKPPVFLHFHAAAHRPQAAAWEIRKGVKTIDTIPATRP